MIFFLQLHGILEKFTSGTAKGIFYDRHFFSFKIVIIYNRILLLIIWMNYKAELIKFRKLLSSDIFSFRSNEYFLKSNCLSFIENINYIHRKEKSVQWPLIWFKAEFIIWMKGTDKWIKLENILRSRRSIEHIIHIVTIVYKCLICFWNCHKWAPCVPS